jgi:hypothetical protein
MKNYVWLKFDESAIVTMRSSEYGYAQIIDRPTDCYKKFVSQKRAEELLRSFNVDSKKLYVEQFATVNNYLLQKDVYFPNYLYVANDDVETLFEYSEITNNDVTFSAKIYQHQHDDSECYIFLEHLISVIAETIRPNYERFFNRLIRFKWLDDNWDGYGALKVSKEVLANAYAFLMTLINDGFDLKDFNEEFITPTQYGTITFDFYENNKPLCADNFVSVEIGKSKIGWFTHFEHGIDNESDGRETDFWTILDILKNNIREIYGNKEK